ncbi:hypothetical protein Tc00.1047053507727.19 [Trypanosoma cruzi]|uniref:Uncharacterized protein n=1 Tax=Trypanosoma cruzi (strain CL Brener) TaxID=353153 RepID=Q4CNB8_TRYCC|nr:hypothetical protein Tc00.1047053507727.19 [Trypanosoma cruzi]EAN81771.1 hypothetical protein Tc00.1047053507727.19 [Trypanosoma cruzi]|eukprot:XP_803217.1 hypothetical protein [Trypanosoma cruzi strain CL Brener]
MRCAAGISSPCLCPFVCGKVVGEDMCGSERGWLPASPCALENSIHVALLDGVSRHPGYGEEEDEEDLLWAEGGWMTQSPSVSFPVLLAVHTESVNLSECGMKGLCRFVCATQSSSLQAVVTVRCGAVPFDEGGARCHGCCAPRPFIASAPSFLFFGLCEFFLRSHNVFFCSTMNLLWELWFWCLLHGASPCVSVAVLPRGAKAFDGVFALLFAPCSRPCLAMAAAVELCDCAPAMRVSSFAAAPSLCWWGRRRANALELRPSGRGKAPTAADGDGLCCRRCDGMTSPVSQLTEMDEGRTASPAPLIILSVHCSHTPHAPQSSVATTIRMSVSQLECKIDVDLFPRV